MLLVQPNNLSVAELSAIRAEIAAVPLPEGEDVGSRARLTVVRSGVMKPVLRQAIRDGSSTKAELNGLESILSGPLAMLTCPSLSPPYVSRLLSVIDKALGNRALSPAAQAGKPHTRTANANPRMVPLAAIVEGNRLVDVPALRDVSKLPDLQTLRAQIVGLLSSPASQLAGVLSMASGGQLSLTLEGRKRQLEESSQ
jgi:ribosomal protein L10